MRKELDLTLETRLLRGKNVWFEDIEVKNLTLGEIDDIGMVEYLSVVNFSTLTKDKLIDRKMAKHFQDYSFFDLVVMFEPLRDMFLKLLGIFTVHDEDDLGVAYIEQLNIFIVTNKDHKGKIRNSNFEDFLEFIRTVYCIPKIQKESEREDIDEEMASLLREFEEAEAKIANENNTGTSINSVIEAVSTKHPNLNLLDIWNYTMYQLMKTYYRLELLGDVENMMRGVYSGCIDTKKINLKEYHWAKKLD